MLFYGYKEYPQWKEMFNIANKLLAFIFIATLFVIITLFFKFHLTMVLTNITTIETLEIKRA